MSVKSKVRKFDYACLEGSIEDVTKLFERYNLDITHLRLTNNNALFNACFKRKLDVVKFLFDHFSFENQDYIRAGETVITMCAKMGLGYGHNFEVIKYLFEEKKLPKSLFGTSITNLLICACQWENYSLIEYLLDVVGMRTSEIKLSFYENDDFWVHVEPKIKKFVEDSEKMLNNKQNKGQSRQ